MGTPNQMFWTLLGFWTWLLYGPGFTAAVPVATEWPAEGEDDYTATEMLPWGTDHDYFEPTTMVVTDTAFSVTEEPQTLFTTEFSGSEGTSEVPGENQDSADETSSSRPVEKETVNSVPDSTKGNADPATDVPLEIGPPEETIEEVTKKEALVNANSSRSSLSKGTINTTNEVMEETTSPILLTKGTPSAFLDKEPEVTELVTDAYSGANDPAHPTVPSNGDLLASGEEGETLPDKATGEISTGSGLNPTIRSPEETTDAILGPNGDSLGDTPSLSSQIPASDPEVLPGLLSSPLPESDAITTKLVTPSEQPSSDLASTSDTVSESLEPSEHTTVSLQPSPEEKEDLGAEPTPAKGRGDVDSFTASDLDAIGSSSGPDVGLESTAGVPTEESEDPVDAEAPDSSAVDGAVETSPGAASSGDTTSKISDLGYETTETSPIRLSITPGSSSQLPEDGEAEATSATQGKAAEEEGSGSATSNEESPFASSLLEPSPTSDGEDGAADLNSGTASSKLNSELETASSEQGDIETATTSSSNSNNEIASTSTSEVSSIKNAGAPPDAETLGPDDEVETEAQGASGTTALPTSLPDVPSDLSDLETGEEESPPTGVPGNVGSSEDSTVGTGSDVSGSAADQEATTTLNEGQDLPPSDPEHGTVYATQKPVGSGALPTGESPRQPPVESVVALVPYDSSEGESPVPSGSSVSKSDETELSPDGSLASSQLPPESDTDSEASEGTEDFAGVNGEETSNAPTSQENEIAPARTGSPIETNGNQDSGTNSPSKDEVVTVTSELASNEEPLSANSDNQDETGTVSPDAQLSSGDAKETSTSFAGIAEAKSGELADAEPSFPPIVNTGTSEAVQGQSQETSSLDAPSGASSLESEAGEATLSPSSGIFGPSQGTEESKNEGVDAEPVGVTASSGGQTGNGVPVSGTEPGPAEGEELPVEQSDTLTAGETSSPSLGEETSSPSSSGEESLLPSDNAAQPPPDNTAVAGPETTKGEEQMAGPTGEQEATLAPSVAEPASSLTAGMDSPASGEAEDEASKPAAESQPSSPSIEEVDSPSSGEAEGETAQTTSPSTEGEANPATGSTEDMSSQPASPSTDGVDNPASGSPEDKVSQPSSPPTEGVDGPASGSAEDEASQPAAGSQPASPSTDGVDSSSSGTAEDEASQPAAGSQPASPSTDGVDSSSSGTAEDEASQPSAGSQPASPSTDGVDSSSSGTAEDEASQPSAGSQPASPSTDGVDSSSSGTAEDEASQPAAGSQPASPSTDGVDSSSSGSAEDEASQPAAGSQPASPSTDGVDSSSSGTAEDEASQPAAASQPASPSTDGVDSSSSGTAEDEASQPSAGSQPASPSTDGVDSSSSGTAEDGASQPAAGSQPASTSTEGVDSSSSGTAEDEASQPAAGSQPASPSIDGVDSSSSGTAEDEAPQPAAGSQPASPSTDGVDSSSSGTAEDGASQPAAGSQPASPSMDGVDSSSSGTAEDEASQPAAGSQPASPSMDGVDSSSSGSPEDKVSQPSSPSIEGVDSPASGSAEDEASQPSAGSQPASSSTDGMDSPASGSPEDKVSQPSSPSNEGVNSPASGSAEDEASQPPAGSQPASPSTEGVDSQASGSPEDKVSQPSSPSTEGVNSPASGSAENEVSQPAAGSQPASTSTEGVDSQASGSPEDKVSQPSSPSTEGVDSSSSGSAEDEASQPAVGSQPASPSSEGVDSSGSGSTEGKASQSSPDGAGTAGLGASEGQGQMAGSSSLTGGETSLTPSATGSQSSSPSTEGLDSPTSGSIEGKASQPLSPSGSGAGSGEHVDGQSSSGTFSKSQVAGETPIGKEVGIISSLPSDAAGKTVGSLPNVLPGSSIGPSADSGEGPAGTPGVAGGSVGAANSVFTSGGMKKSSAVSSGGEIQPSLSGGQLSPATVLHLPAMESGPALKAGGLPSSSKAGAASLPSGKLTPSVVASPSISSSGSKASKAGPSAASSNSSPLPSSSKSELPTGGIKSMSSGSKATLSTGPDTRVAAAGPSLLPAKSTQTTSKTSNKKSDAAPENQKKEKKTSNDDRNTAKKGTRPAVPVPVSTAVRLFPYGPSANDKEYVERKVDFNSPLFRPEIGVPLGKTLRNYLYFTDNGQIIFPTSDKDVSSYPNLPSKGFDGREKVAMIAVFSDNADFSRGGTIYYQEYVTLNSAKPPLVQSVEAKIQQYMKSSYSARWTLKITWVKVQPYMAQKRNGGTNTYQAILTTDGYRTYALFLYQEGGMLWDYTKLSATNVVIGYTSGDGFFRTDDLMNETPAEKYRPDHVEGYNTGVRGLWLYKLPSRVQVNYRQRCLDWLSHEGQPLAWNKGLPRCPCSLQQALSDNRYTQCKKGLPDSRLTMLYSSTPNKYGAGVRCLYNNKNQLVEGHQERVWKDTRKASPYNDEELKLYDWCCNQARNPQLCDKYNQKRPRVGCDGYRPPVQN